MDRFPAFLIDGYKSFMSDRYDPEQGRYRQLADHGQSPTTMIIACCDSRAAPETIFSAGPGELFVLRNVAALVPPYKPNDDYHSTSATKRSVMGQVPEREGPRRAGIDKRCPRSKAGPRGCRSVT